MDAQSGIIESKVESIMPMRRLDRMNLVDQIGRELQKQMSYRDIDSYLSGFGIDCEGKSPSVNSKWVYTKELLQPVPDDVVVQIADELGIEHSYRNPTNLDLSEGKYWAVGHFRLFLSHISAFKEKAAQVQLALRPYGISAFVAHEDIEPTKEWLTEIERALFSMDALAAILTPGFNDSKWTDHEVGIAVGRGVLVIPIRRGLDPYGFVGKYQALQGLGKTVQQVADAVFHILLTNPKSRDRIIASLVDLFLFAKDEEDAQSRLTLLARAETLPAKYLDKLRANVESNALLTGIPSILDGVNKLLVANGTPEIVVRPPTTTASSDIPF